MSILQTHDLRKYYGSGDTQVRALDGVDLAVEPGEFVAIVGTSGSGKSTLLHMLGGLDRPTAGKVEVDGKDIFALKDEALTIFRRRKIGFVFQSYNLVPVLSVYENIVLPVELDGRRVDQAYLREVVDTLGLGKKLRSLPNQLSGGQQQRVAIARALAANRTRNLVAALAIALTALLFTSLFTIAMSLNEGFQQSSFRQAGGMAHGTFKRLEESQIGELSGDPLIEAWGKRLFVGMPSAPPFHKAHVEVSYCDANEAAWMFCIPVEGRLPESDTEAATDTRVLALLGVEPELGAQFTLELPVDGVTVRRTFTLCGWWTYDEACIASNLLVSEAAARAMLAEAGLTGPVG